VTLTGKQKAAMLLISLDAMTAAELLKGIDAKVVQELAVELAYLDAAGYRSSKESLRFARQFYNSLQTGEEFHFERFLNDMLKSTVGDNRARQIQTQVQDSLQKRDPFIPIRSADSYTLASVLEDEHPQAVAVVLSELEARKSSEVLGLLGEDIQFRTVSRMTSCESVTAEARTRIAEMLCKRLEAATPVRRSGALRTRPEKSLRKIALILRNLGKELRNGLLGVIHEKDNEAGETIANLMIVWEDIPQVADRALQQALRGIEAQRLALALVRADEAIAEKIRSNIPERTSAMVDEEASLMSAPKKEYIEGARENIVKVLREMNKKGELTFVEE